MWEEQRQRTVERLGPDSIKTQNFIPEAQP